MDKSIVIIGKGYSVTKCTKEFIDSHDEVAIINSPVYEGYEHLISNRADYLFTNKTGMLYSDAQIKKLGLKEMIFTGRKEQRFQRNSNLVKSIYPNPNLYELSTPLFGVYGASSGIQALMYLESQKKYNKFSLVGFDFYQVGLPPYYFDPKYAHPELKYLWGNGNVYKNNVINNESLHSVEKSIEYITNMIKNNKNIEFNIITLNSKFNDIKIDNLKIINNE
jgi:hypothetical protein